MVMNPMQPAPKLAERVAEQIESQVILNLSPGDRLPTLRVLATELAVSVSTLQSALAVLRQKGLVESRQGSGVYVAERDDRLRIGIYSELDVFDSRCSLYFRALTGGLRTRLPESGVEPLLYIGHVEPGPNPPEEPTCPQFWTDAASGELDAAVILNVPSSELWRARVAACPVPTVGAMTGYEVSEGLAQMAERAVRVLANQGCRRLGLISWTTVAPFREAVAKAGLETRDAWIRADRDPGVRGSGWDEFREIWAVEDGRPDGLVVLDDMLFDDVQMAIFELGVQVPEELKLVAMANRGVSPPVRLTSTLLENDPQAAIDALADLVLAKLRGDQPTRASIMLPFRQREVVVADLHNAARSS